MCGVIVKNRQEASGLLIKLGIKITFSKIRLLDDILL